MEYKFQELSERLDLPVSGVSLHKSAKAEENEKVRTLLGGFTINLQRRTPEDPVANQFLKSEVIKTVKELKELAKPRSELTGEGREQTKIRIELEVSLYVEEGNVAIFLVLSNPESAQTWEEATNIWRRMRSLFSIINHKPEIVESFNGNTLLVRVDPSDSSWRYLLLKERLPPTLTIEPSVFYSKHADGNRLINTSLLMEIAFQASGELEEGAKELERRGDFVADRDRKRQLFISYDRVDRGWAEWIAWCLNKSGYNIIFDAWNFRPGSNFILEINEAIKSADAVLAIISPDYIRGILTHSVWATAYAKDPTGRMSKLLPIIVKECELDGLLAQITPINLIGLDEEEAEKELTHQVDLLYKDSRNKTDKHKVGHEVLPAPGFPSSTPLLRQYSEPSIDDNIVSEIFKLCFQGFRGASQWINDRGLNPNFFSSAGKIYASQLEERYDLIRIFNMSSPIPLRSIYTRVNILKKITARNRATMEDLQKLFELDRRGFGIKQETHDGLQVVNQLDKCVLLGKPGAGKTTFLKYLALQAIDDLLAEKRVPIFIGLKDWSDYGKPLEEYVINQFEICGFPDSKSFVEKLLLGGNCLILFDGLDEVSSNIEDTIGKIRPLLFKYSANKFIISCRIAAYNNWFENFSDVEIADFSDKEVESFVNKWFGSDIQTATQCLMKMNDDESIRELASIPLLLALLCLAFDETLSFPPNKAELYKEAITTLLKKWDTTRRIKREELYRNFSTGRKETMLSQLAFEFFEKGQYFFKQHVLENQIIEFIKHLPEVNESSLELDGNIVLKSIEAQHGLLVERAKGIYSFSHLTFQEYFTAKYIIDNAAKGAIRDLINKHITDPRWYEVFLIVAGMLPKGDEFILLMKHKIDSLARRSLYQIILITQNTMTKQEAKLFKEDIPHGFARSYSLYRMLEHVNQDVENYPYRRHVAFARAYNKHFESAVSISRDTCAELVKFLGLSVNAVFDRLFDTEIEAGSPILYHSGIIEELLLYLKANYLLMRCLNSECYITKDTRQVIADELLSVPSKSALSASRMWMNIKRYFKG